MTSTELLDSSPSRTTPSSERQHFDRLTPHLVAALAYAHHSHDPEDLWRLAREGRLQIWYGMDSIIVTEMVSTPARKTLHFFLAGGALPEIERMYPPILEWGRLEGCDDATMAGREGWGRTFLKHDGWTKAYTVFRKEL